MISTWMLLLGVIFYLIASDKSILNFLYYVTEIINFYFSRKVWWLKNNPDFPWVKWTLNRKYAKIAKQLLDERSNR